MTIECIKIKDLISWVASPAFKRLKVIPISRHRAQSQARNPRAQPDDVALVLIYDETNLLGYLGILPDQIFYNNQPHRIAWMSCIWVNPKARGKGIAKQLLTKGFEVWDNQLLATEFTAPAKSLYDKMELFDDLHQSEGLRAYLRMDLAYLLPKKNPKYRSFRFAFRLFDVLFNAVNDIRWWFYRSDQSSTIYFVDRVDDAIAEFIESKQKDELFQRNKKELNWILQNPWLSDSAEAKEDATRYHFSSYEKEAEFVNLKMEEEGQVVAYAMLLRRGSTLKVSYLYADAKSLKQIAVAIIDYMRKERLSILTVYHQSLVDYLKENRRPFFLMRPFERSYLIAKKRHQNWGKGGVIQDGDGDVAFT